MWRHPTFLGATLIKGRPLLFPELLLCLLFLRTISSDRAKEACFGVAGPWSNTRPAGREVEARGHV